MAKQRVTVYFASNRQPILEAGTGKIVDFGPDLGPVSGLNVRYGSAQVEVDLAANKAAMIAGSLKVASEQLTGAPGEPLIFGSNTIFDALRENMSEKKRPTIAFIHGFSNSFTDAIVRAGWILGFYGIDANMFVFTWPSKGASLNIPLPFVDYIHDRGMAAASGPAIARTIRRLHDYVDRLPFEVRCNQNIHLLCHSMGNYVLRNALQALMRLPDPGPAVRGDVRALAGMSADAPDPSVLRRSFDKIVLAAADEDSDAFDDPLKLKFLPRIGQSVTVYHNKHDWILNTLSAATKFNGPRLGNDGPDNMGSINDKVTAVDASDVVTITEDFQSHQYYRIFPVVRDDIVAVLEGTPQNAVPNRTVNGAGRYAIKAAGARRRARRATG